MGSHGKLLIGGLLSYTLKNRYFPRAPFGAKIQKFIKGEPEGPKQRRFLVRSGNVSLGRGTVHCHWRRMVEKLDGEHQAGHRPKRLK